MYNQSTGGQVQLGFDFAEFLLADDPGPTALPSVQPGEPSHSITVIPLPEESATARAEITTVTPVNLDESTSAFTATASTVTTTLATKPLVKRKEAPWPKLTASGSAGATNKKGRAENNIRALKLLATLTAGEPLTPEQRTILCGYSGWGSIGAIFDAWPVDSGWRNLKSDLLSAANEDEVKGFEENTLNGHFTPLFVAEAMWAALERFGFKGGRVLEPSAGTGHFLGTMPGEMAKVSEVTAIEKEPVSGKILSALYGDAARVKVAALEKMVLPEDYFDLVIGNVPFGEHGVPDNSRKPWASWNIHNYFIGRALSVVRPGGLVALVTSAFTMDARLSVVREYLMQRAELLAAIRLPIGAFSESASTDVMTDILFLRRKAAGTGCTAEEKTLWLDSPSAVEVFDESRAWVSASAKFTSVNAYWGQKPQNVLGQWHEVSGRYGAKAGVVLDNLADLPGLLTAALEKLDSNVYSPSDALEREVVIEVANRNSLPGAMSVEGQRVLRRTAMGSLEDTGFKGLKAQRAAAMIAMREATVRLVTAQSEPDASDETLASCRFELNVRYDAFVSKFGVVRSVANAQVFAREPSWPLLQALEVQDIDSGETRKAAIFTERTAWNSVEPGEAETDEDALAICLAERNCIDVAHLGRLRGCEGLEVLNNLLEARRVFVDPATNLYVAAEEYCSGNVKAKLELAEAMGDEYGQNVEALKLAIPADIPASQIDVMLGASWVDITTYEAFFLSITKAHSVTVERNEATGDWNVTILGAVRAEQTKWETARVFLNALATHAMNQSDPVVQDSVGDGYVTNVAATTEARIKVGEINDAFKTWIWSDASRSIELSRRYNDLMNVWAKRVYDGSRLRLPGFTRFVEPRPAQLNAIARVLTGGNVLLGHTVGAGKTLEMVCSSMELVRLGLAKKPLHVVMNSTLGDYAIEFQRAYPNANLLVASEDDFTKARRREFAARAAMGRWDAIIITQSMWERIRPDETLAKAMLEDYIADLRASNESGRYSRQTTAQIKKWEAKAEQLAGSYKKDQVITLREMGVDQVFLDEAHMYKNLPRQSRITNVAGLPNTSSQRAFDTLLKTRSIMLARGGEKGIVMATGTYVSNTLGEVFVFQNYLQPAALSKAGVAKFDDWVAQFARAVTTLEVSPDGGSFRMAKRFRSFVNLPELMGMFGQVADIQTKEMLKLPVPPMVTGQPQVSVAQPSEIVKAGVAALVSRAERIKNERVPPKEDNMLAVTSEGDKLALDARLVIPGAAFDPNGKIANCINNVARIYRETTHFRGAQIIFCDMGTPGGAGLNLYEDMRMRLVDAGIPEQEIAFIHDADTAGKRSLLFAKVRAGQIRVLLASTVKGGTGVNVQTRLYAGHDLTTPWRPSDLDQRLGRYERPGNTCHAIESWRYVTQGTFDAYKWQNLSIKAAFISQVFNGDGSIRTIEDGMAAALTYEEVKAIACGNPAVREKATVDARLVMLRIKARMHRDVRNDAARSLRNWIHTEKQMASKLESEVAYCDALESVIKDPILYVGGVTLKGIEQINALVQEVSQTSGKSRKGSMRVGSFNNQLSLWLGDDSLRYKNDWILEGFGIHPQIGQYKTGRGLLEALPGLLEERRKKRDANQLAYDFRGKELEALEQSANSSDPYQEEIRQLEIRSSELAVEVGATKDLDVAGNSIIVSELASKIAEGCDTPLDEENDTAEEQSV